jgi:hypothetical protein
MQLGISIMLSFSVFKLRLSDDVPVQADIIPLINIYFTLCMSFSLSAMIWFSLRNVFERKEYLPCCVRYVVFNYLMFLHSNKEKMKLEDIKNKKKTESRNSSKENSNLKKLNDKMLSLRNNSRPKSNGILYNTSDKNPFNLDYQTSSFIILNSNFFFFRVTNYKITIFQFMKTSIKESGIQILLRFYTKKMKQKIKTYFGFMVHLLSFYILCINI